MNPLAHLRILYALLAVLAVDCIFEIAFVSSMVTFLHNNNDYKDIDISFETANGQEILGVQLTPLHLVLFPGHESNGYSTPAVGAVAILGAVVLWRRAREYERGNRSSITNFFFGFWVVVSVLNALYALAALISANVLVAMTANNTIDPSVLASVQNTSDRRYPGGIWAPQTWFPQLLAQNLVSAQDRSNIEGAVWYIQGWRWNLIPATILGVVVAIKAVDEWRYKRTLSLRATTVGFDGTEVQVQEVKADFQIATKELSGSEAV